MKRALRFPSRWAGRPHTLAIAVVLLTALGACSSMDNIMYGAREGTIEYPGSGERPGAAASYVVKHKDTVDGIARRYGVSPQTIIDSTVKTLIDLGDIKQPTKPLIDVSYLPK